MPELETCVPDRAAHPGVLEDRVPAMRGAHAHGRVGGDGEGRQSSKKGSSEASRPWRIRDTPKRSPPRLPFSATRALERTGRYATIDGQGRNREPAVCTLSSTDRWPIPIEVVQHEVSDEHDVKFSNENQCVLGAQPPFRLKTTLWGLLPNV